ncbi:DNA polymerase family B-domain-containing protein [Tribonema minus]|uniref:DNA-directed DNA polymerase n=1 Tax=Tribonema minus TaxID=303371 RepID=A0A836C9W2_9STRA|nr:DNA polymerase family B-domain-containing protein [Tribonema minus]
MYGCLGFTHGRFCAQPIAALVTSKGREALQRTVDVTQTELGMEVVYGDTDSVMVNTRTKDLPQAKQQASTLRGNLIKREVNKLYSSLELDLDGIFQAMLLLKKKKYAALVVVENADGTIGVQREVKGLDLVRRDWCGLSKEAGQHVLDRILSGDARETVVESIHEHLRALADAMRAGAVPIGQYVITKGLSKPPQDYPNAKNEPHLQVAMAMQRAGKPVNVGNHIPYIICRQTQTPAERARHPEDVMRSGGALVPDVEWYLAQQMVPPIARLCEPIEGTSAAIIAQQMGLDPARFSKGGGGGGGGNRDNDAEDWAFTPVSLMSDEERFKDCMPLRARCAGSSALTPAPSPPPQPQPLWGHRNEVACFSALVQALVLAIRAAQARAAEGWYVCDDTCCGARTRDVGVRGSACPAPGCRQGRLSPEYSEKDLYEQLKSFEALFDLKRAQKRCHDRTKLPTGQLAVPKTHERVLELLLVKAKAEVDSSDYNWVKPTLWATVFGTARAAHCA